jgi:hypothetical protein
VIRNQNFQAAVSLGCLSLHLIGVTDVSQSVTQQAYKLGHNTLVLDLGELLARKNKVLRQTLFVNGLFTAFEVSV